MNVNTGETEQTLIKKLQAEIIKQADLIEELKQSVINDHIVYSSRIERLESINKEMYENHKIKLIELEDKVKLQLAYIKELQKP